MYSVSVLLRSVSGCIVIEISTFGRFFYWIPAVGVGSINRRVPKLRNKLESSLGGIKKLHQLCDIGQPGQLNVRLASCHKCSACLNSDFGNCENIEFTGLMEEVQLDIDRATPARTRVALELAAQSIAVECENQTQHVAFQVVNKSEPFLIGQPVSFHRL